MTEFLPYFVLIMLLVVALGFFNEKVTKITYEISLMLFAILIGAVLLGVDSVISNRDIGDILTSIRTFDLEDFLMEGVLCFMLFAGSCHMKLYDFKRLSRQVGVLSLLATFLGAVFYGVLFFGFAKLIGLDFSLPACLMFGSIVAPTDPIAATSILKKFGLPKDIGFLIEGESLLNDGVGVALFVCFSGIVTATESENALTVLLREVLGAAVVGIVISVLCWFVFKRTEDVHRRIFTSMLAVAAAYLLCDRLDCSGAIASVICGVLFSSFRNYEERTGKIWDLSEYDTFWDVLDDMLNSVLYVILGLSFISILQMKHVLIVSAIAIVCNLLGRAGSVGVSTFVMGEIPDGYNKSGFVKLLTWGGLRGGLCIALAMSTKSMLDAHTYHIILGATYAIVFFTTVVQGLTMKRVYDRISRKMAA